MQYPRLSAAFIFSLALPFSLSLGSGTAQAAVIQTYASKAEFLALAGVASLTGPIPDSGAQGLSVTLGDVTFSTRAFTTSSTIVFGNAAGPDYWSTLIPGNEIAISGSENLDISIDLGGPVTSFGFDFHEPSTIGQIQDGTNSGYFHDSLFTITLRSGVSVVGSQLFDPANDQLLFFGVTADVGFDSVRIEEELAGVIDPADRFGRVDASNDNEYFGEFYAAPIGAAGVPEPGTLALLGLSLAGLGLRRSGGRRG